MLVDGLTTSYLEAGEGDPVVLLHGGEFGASAELGWERKDRRELDRLRVENRAYLFRKNFPQTLTSKLAFAGLMLLHCAHRTVNREWSGLAGLLEGLWRELSPGHARKRARESHACAALEPQR